MAQNHTGVITIHSSAARTETPTKVNQENKIWRGGIFVIRVSVVPGAAPAITPTIQGYDPVSGQYWTILTGAVITAVGTVVLRVYPGLTVVNNLTVSDILPPQFAIDMVHGDSDSATYSVTFHGTP